MESILRIISSLFSILSFIGIVTVGIFHKLASDKLTGNDLLHLSKDVKEIRDEQKCMKVELINQGKLISAIDSRCNARTECK